MDEMNNISNTIEHFQYSFTTFPEMFNENFRYIHEVNKGEVGGSLEIQFYLQSPEV